MSCEGLETAPLCRDCRTSDCKQFFKSVTLSLKTVKILRIQTETILCVYIIYIVYFFIDYLCKVILRTNQLKMRFVHN